MPRDRSRDHRAQPQTFGGLRRRAHRNIGIVVDDLGVGESHSVEAQGLDPARRLANRSGPGEHRAGPDFQAFDCHKMRASQVAQSFTTVGRSRLLSSGQPDRVTLIPNCSISPQ
jgi:hypothetical protein